MMVSEPPTQLGKHADRFLNSAVGSDKSNPNPHPIPLGPAPR
jgi:hypothetical protein